MLNVIEFDKFFTKIDNLTIYTLLPRTEEAYSSLQSYYYDSSSFVVGLQVIIKENNVEDIIFLTAVKEGEVKESIAKEVAAQNVGTTSYSARGTLPTTLYLSLVRALRSLL